MWGTKKQKTMKTLTSKQKELILTKKGEVSTKITNSISRCGIEGGKIYHTYTTGTKRNTSNYSVKETIVDILKASNYKYTEGNDSPRGGRCGDFLKVSKTAALFLQSI